MIKLISSKVARILCKDEKHTDNYELYIVWDGSFYEHSRN